MSGDESHDLDDVVIAYLEAVEAGQTPDRARYPELAQFFADEDAVAEWTAPLREAARAAATVSEDPGRTTDLAAPGAVVPRLASFGDYEVIGELGRGGMGVVYKARHLKFQRLVALKMILAGQHAGAQREARFLAEARAVARLQHPNIVQVHEIGEHEGMPYFSLEFVEGGSLAERLKGPPLSDKEAAHLVEMLARAVQHAHERDIVHRDLKPANVLLTRDGAPKIADFGLARFLGADGGQTASGDVIGTASYMAPEQAEGNIKDVGPTADVYSLGAILYELLTGRPPFSAATLLATLDQVRQEAPQRPRVHNPRVDRSLEAICLKCLSKDRGERYPSAEALADDLERFLDGRPVFAGQGSASRWVGVMLRETRYTEVMTRWGGVWMGTAVVYFLVCLAKSLMLWSKVEDHGPYFIIWAACFLGIAGVSWFCRFRSGPPLSHVERQLVQIWAIFWTGFFLTAWLYQLGKGDIEHLLPILVLLAAISYGCMATILGGSFWVMAGACLATAGLEATWPEAGPLISAAICSPALFWLGWKYWRRGAST
jgi:eukaryotic-like serine/threonine-protein kinase